MNQYYKTILLGLAVFSVVETKAQLSAGLKAHYPFSGNINDLSGNNHHCTAVGNVNATSDRFSYPNCAYNFPGDTGAYLRIPFASDFDIAPAGALSISLWFNGGTSALGDFEGLFDKKAVNSDYHLALYDLNKPSFGGTFSPIAFGTGFNPDANWHHLVGVYSNGNWTLYIDNAVGGTGSATNITQSNGNVYIGRGFLGKIDDIRFYNRTLSAAEVQQIFQLGSSCAPNSVDKVIAPSMGTVFPQPAHKLASLQVPSAFGSEVKVQVIDIRGKLFIERDFETEQDNGLIRLSLDGLTPGLYFVSISDAHGQQVTYKLLKD